MEGYVEIKVTQELKTKVEKLVEGLDDKNKPKGYTLSEKKHWLTDKYLMFPKTEQQMFKEFSDNSGLSTEILEFFYFVTSIFTADDIPYFSSYNYLRGLHKIHELIKSNSETLLLDSDLCRLVNWINTTNI